MSTTLFRAATLSTNPTISSLILTAGAGGTTDGQVYNDSTQKSISVYENGIKQILSGVIFTQITDQTVTNTISETTIIGAGVGTTILPANFFIIGKTIRIRVGGIYSTPALGAIVTIKVKYGSTILANKSTTSLFGGASSLEFDGEVLITCRTTGITGTVVCHGDIEYATGITGTIAVDPLNNGGVVTTINTTTSNALDITVTWDSNTTTRIATSITTTIEVLN